MKLKILTLLFVAGLSLSSCSSMRVSSERSPGANLARYHTYAWAPPAPNHPKDSVLDQNIQSALETSLQQNGFARAPEGATPDFLVRYSVASREKTVVDPGTAEIGYGDPFWGGYMAFPPTVESYREGSLIVDFIDGHSKTPFWRGVAEDVVEDRSKVVEKAQEASRKIIAEYREDEAKRQVA